MPHDFRCDCFITSALDVLGDRWNLVIIKHMMLGGKSTFKEFIEADEAIASNILAARLKRLEDFGLISKHSLRSNKKAKVYLLTARGIALAPILAELALWSHDHLKEHNTSLVIDEHIEALLKNKTRYVRKTVKAYRSSREEIRADLIEAISA